MTQLPDFFSINPVPKTPQATQPVKVGNPRYDTISSFQAIEDTLDLSAASRNLPETFHALSEEEQDTYLKNLARMLHGGVVGTETLEIGGRPYQSFASARFADQSVAHARIYR